MRKPLIYCLLGVLAAVYLHLTTLSREVESYRQEAQGRSFEDLSIVLGDHTYYRNSILSLLYDFETRLKLFRSSRTAYDYEKVKPKFTRLENLYGAFYPYPPNRPGHSWTGALLSFLVPSYFFDQQISRLMWIALLLNVLNVVLIFFIVKSLVGGVLASFLSVIFYWLDPAILHTSYHTQSHTMAGITWLLAAIYTSQKGMMQKSSKMTLFGFSTSLCFLSSSHTVFWLLPLLAFTIFTLFKERRFQALRWVLGGALLPLLYLVSVDLILELPQKQVPSFVSELISYVFTESNVMSEIPVQYRWMWDFRPLHLYFYFCLPLFCIVLWNVRGNFSWHSLKSPLWFQTFFMLAGGLLLASTKSIPLLRVMTPFMVFLNMAFGILTATAIQSRGLFGKSVAILIISLSVLNHLVQLEILRPVLSKVPELVLSLDDVQAMKQNQQAYFQDLHLGRRAVFRPPVEPKYWTKTLPAFLAESSVQALSDDYYVELLPHRMVDTFAPTNRFYRYLTPFPANQVNPQMLQSDFRLYSDLMELIQTKKLSQKDYLEVSREPFVLGVWDHEVGYWLQFKNGFRAFAKGTPLEHVDMRKIYYFNLGKLRQIAF